MGGFLERVRRAWRVVQPWTRGLAKMWSYGAAGFAVVITRAMTDLFWPWLVLVAASIAVLVLAALRTWAPRLDVDPNAKIKSIKTNRAIRYEQKTASERWVITHDLGYKPMVRVVDSAGNVVEGSVRHHGDDLVVVEFGGAFSGEAYLH